MTRIHTQKKTHTCTHYANFGSLASADPHLSYMHIIHLADTVLNIGAAAVPAG